MGAFPRRFPRAARRRAATRPVLLLAICGLLVFAGAIAFGLKWPRVLPAVNAALNSLAALLLVAGYVQIKRRRERAHKALMLWAFGVSALFLTCYLVYHSQVLHKPFPGTGPVKGVYLTILFSHILLAITVPFLAIATIYLGLKDRRAAHRRLARFTLPIWLYVSVTGVVIYLMLYVAFAPR